MQQQQQQIRDRVAQCIALAEQKFGISMPTVDVRFDLRGRAAGMACMRGNQFFLRFNVGHMKLGGKTWEHLLNETVPHEVAHSVPSVPAHGTPPRRWLAASVYCTGRQWQPLLLCRRRARSHCPAAALRVHHYCWPQVPCVCCDSQADPGRTQLHYEKRWRSTDCTLPI